MMSQAEPAGAEKRPGRLRLGLRRSGRLIFGFLDFLDLLVFAVIAVLAAGALVIGLWENPSVRPWLIGILVAAPVLLTLRGRSD